VVKKLEQVAPKAVEVAVLPVPVALTKIRNHPPKVGEAAVRTVPVAPMKKKKHPPKVAEADMPARSLRAQPQSALKKTQVSILH